MSHSTLLVVQPNGDVCHDSEYSNSWGFGAMIWNALVQKYDAQVPLPAELLARWTPAQIREMGLGGMDRWPLLWEAAPKLPLTWWERNALFATYDRHVVHAADLVVMADSFERFADAYSQPGRACSLREMAVRLRDLSAAPVPPDVCFQVTSVAEDMWHVYRDEEHQDGRPYSVREDALHTYVDVEPSQQRPANEVR